MRLLTILLSLAGAALSGCMVIPAKAEKQRVSGEPIKYEKPAIGLQPFGEDGGQFRFRYHLKDKRLGIEFRKDF